LWFIGVLRDHLGNREDQFFATVFLGSGLLFLAMLFAAGALVGGLLSTFGLNGEAFVDSTTFHFARSVAYGIINVYAAKVAGAFMISASTLLIYTNGSTLDSVDWLCVSGRVVVRRALPRVGLRAFSIMDSDAQCLHPTGKLQMAKRVNAEPPLFVFPRDTKFRSCSTPWGQQPRQTSRHRVLWSGR
jgi:hypothetical protein